jgi:hypothetical protein
MKTLAERVIIGRKFKRQNNVVLDVGTGKGCMKVVGGKELIMCGGNITLSGRLQSDFECIAAIAELEVED